MSDVGATTRSVWKNARVLRPVVLALAGLTLLVNIGLVLAVFAPDAWHIGQHCQTTTRTETSNVSTPTGTEDRVVTKKCDTAVPGLPAFGFAFGALVLLLLPELMSLLPPLDVSFGAGRLKTSSPLVSAAQASVDDNASFQEEKA